MRVVLTAVSGVTAAACLWLAVMFVLLHRPGFERGLVLSLLFVSQALLTMAVVNRWLPGRAWRPLILAGAAGVVWGGATAIANALNSPHFEGFSVIIGAALVAQGVLTAGHLITTGFASSSKVHQFGN